jgi:phage gp46-like protein
MADFATIILSDQLPQAYDWNLDGVDLETDEGLETAIIISLLTDRLAAADDEIPDGSGDRRGWWGDLPLDDAPDQAQPDYIGSRLWLLARAKALPETAARAKTYTLEALAWLLADGVAASIDVETQWIAQDQLAIGIAVARIGANGSLVNRKYDVVWNATLYGNG